MSAVEIIKANLDVEKILDYYNAKGIAHYGDFIRCCCCNDVNNYANA